jgi:PAS domain S-box-containing protein
MAHPSHPTVATSADAAAGWPAGSSEMAARVRAFDWSRTPLGPTGSWPQALKIAVDICLASRFPMFVWWGPGRINLYNDAYAPVLGKRHPDALGRPARAVWAEIWDVVGPQAEAVLARGEATWNERVRLDMERHGYVEETYFTWSYSPIPGDDGRVGGLYCACSEETGRVLAERERDRLAEERRRAEARTREILESITDAFLVVDADWRFTYFNPQGERVLGRPAADMLGKVLWDEYPGLIGGEFERMYRRAVAERVAGSATAFYPDHGRWYEIRAYPAAGGGLSIYFRDVTERAAADAALRESEERFRLMADAVPQFVWITDPAGRAIYFNQKWYDYTGAPRGEIDAAEVAATFVHPDEAAATVAAFDESRRTGRPFHVEHRLRATDGTYRWFTVRGEPYRDPATGQVARWYGVSTDIHHRKRIEERERFLVRLEDAVRTADGPAEATRAAATLLGRHLKADRCAYADVEADQDTFNLTGDYNDGVPSIVGRYTFTAFGAECLRLMRAGEPYVVADAEADLRAAAVRDAYRATRIRAVVCVPLLTGGRFVAAMAVHQAVVRQWTADEVELVQTVAARSRESIERTRVARALRESEERRRLALEAAELGAWNLDAGTLTLTTDERFRAIFGVPADRAGYEDAVAMIHPDDRGRVRTAVAAALRPEVPAPFSVEYRVVRPGGAVRWVFGKGRATFAGDGPARRAVSLDGTVADVTDRKRLEAERERLLAAERAARGEAERTSRMKDEFLATLSHELRTPLNAILGWSQILRRGRMTADEVAQAVDVIERNARGQAQLISDLLDMSRIISGKVRLDVRGYPIADAVRAAVDSVRPAADGKAVRLEAVIDPAVGTVVGDPDRVQQVLWNLLTNALKFTPKGGSVRVALARVDSHVEVTVADTGKGIPPAFLPYVFDRFRQADASTTREHGGLGIGLSIVKSLVELHGGSVDVASAGDGQGATFTVRLPLAAVLTDESDSRPAHPATDGFGRPSRDGAESLAGLRVLVVDDEPDARLLIKRTLEEHGADVVAVGSAGEAMAVFEAVRPEVLLSDVGMPGEDGYSLIRKVRSLPVDRGGAVPAAALTAFARREDRTRAIRAGFQIHVPKPVEAAELVAVVASLGGRAGGPAD